MKTTHFPAVATIACVLAIVSGTALPAPDKYTVKVPDGLALSEVKGYETWEVVSASHAGGGEGMSGSETLNVIVANPAMIKAYAAGIPATANRSPMARRR